MKIVDNSAKTVPFCELNGGDVFRVGAELYAKLFTTYALEGNVARTAVRLRDWMLEYIPSDANVVPLDTELYINSVGKT